MEDEISDEEVGMIIAALVEEGSMEIVGYDSVSDDFTYRLTDKCAILHPELYAAHFSEVNEIAQKLWMDGWIDIVFSEGYTNVAVTEEQAVKIMENIYDFTDNERMFLTVVLEKEFPNWVV